MECPQRSKKRFLLKFRFWTKLLVRQNFSRTKLLVGHNFRHPQKILSLLSDLVLSDKVFNANEPFNFNFVLIVIKKRLTSNLTNPNPPLVRYVRFQKAMKSFRIQ